MATEQQPAEATPDNIEEKREAAKKEIGRLIEERCREIGREIEDVAYELNIRPDVTHQLRNGSLYDKTDKVFAQGYVHSFARILKLNKEQLLELLNTIYQGKSSDGSHEKKHFTSDYERETALHHRRVTLFKVTVPFLFVVAIFGAVIYWKLYLDVPQQGQLVNSEVNTPPPALNFTLVIEEDEVSTIQPIESIANEIVIVGPESQERDLLEFSFTEECWLAVRDSQGREMVSQLYGPGEEISLRGEPPFEVIIGNAEGTTVTYLGEEVALSPDPVDNVARLTIPISPAE